MFENQRLKKQKINIQRASVKFGFLLLSIYFKIYIIKLIDKYYINLNVYIKDNKF